MNYDVRSTTHQIKGRFVYVCVYLPFTKLGTVGHSEQANPFPGIRTKCKFLSVIVVFRIDIHRSLLFLEFFFVFNFISCPTFF